MIILDADAIIKLNRAGVLRTLVTKFDCTLPEAVYQEAVVAGKERLYPDAIAIEEILRGLQPVAVDDIQTADEVLGPGELAVRALARGIPASVVISDDRRFLTQLSVEGIAFVTPADVILLLAQRGDLTLQDARDALERLRHLIRDSVYARVKEELATLEGP